MMSQSASSLSVQDALDDIDLELLQDTVQRDDLAQSVQSLRRLQDDARRELLDGGAQLDYRAVAARQFQINDMLLTLVGELATRQRAVALELRLSPGAPAPAVDAVAAEAGAGLAAEADEAAGPAERSGAALVRQLDTLQACMREDALALQLEVTPTTTPLVGPLLGKLRAAVHSLVVFYSNQLAARQTEINRVFGGALQQQLLARRQAQAAQAAELAELQRRLQALESDAGRAAGHTPGAEATSK